MYTLLPPPYYFRDDVPVISAASASSYIASALPWAQSAHSQYGIPVSVAIAQSAQETGWALPKSANDFFNITYIAHGDPYTTGPYTSGAGTWRAYGSGQDAFLGYGYFITHDGYYTGINGAKIDCRPDLDNALQFLHDIAFDGFDGGPNASTSVKQGYYDTIVSIINTWNLTQYDVTQNLLDIYVDRNSTNSELGSSTNPYHSVTAAINAASSTDAVTIHIVPGAYPETFTTNKHIKFVVNGSGTVHLGP